MEENQLLRDDHVIMNLLKINPLCIILTVSIMTLGILTASAQTSSASISVTTDKTVYSDGDQMTISGTVSTQLNVPVSIVIKDPSGNLVLLGQVSPNPNGTYSTTVTAGGPLWTAVGSYGVYVTYGSTSSTAKTTFEFTGFLPTIPVQVQGQNYNVTYAITNGKVLTVLPNTSTKSLSIRIQPSGSGILTVTIPRSLMDSKNGIQDKPFVVQDDGISATFNETRTDSNSRTLSISFGSNNAQITIIGTIMGTSTVPEFGSVVTMTFTVAMLSALLYFRTVSRTR